MTIRPPGEPAGLILDDPRVRVVELATGDAAPFDGVLLNPWTFERLLEQADADR